jgi:spermidine synthase
MPIFRLTILLGALLLFQVELIIGKHILPWFGGTSAVWITCMLFFQITLLAGYGYGHLLERCQPRTQGRIHFLLMFASVLTLLGQFLFWHTPLILDSSWKPQARGNPLSHVLVLLAVSVGLPFLVLASTAPILQSWWRRIYVNRSPYRLYAVSNFGSFLGLISYPFLIEPFLRLSVQARLWTWAYVAFLFGCCYCTFRASSVPQCADQGSLLFREQMPGTNQRLSTGVVILWVALAGCASAMFLSTTNQLCKNVAPVPLLWILPLGIYLLTFVLCFESEVRYSRRWFHPVFALAILMATFVLFSRDVRAQLLLQVATYAFVLFSCCMVCHGELARLKPDPRYLTQFYLLVAAGGALGGLFVGLAAPFLFRGYWEYEISLWFSAFLFLWALYRDRSSWFYSTHFKSPLLLIGVAALVPESMAFAIGIKQLLSTLPFAFLANSGLLLVSWGKQKPITDHNRRIILIGSCSFALLVVAAVFVAPSKAKPDKIAAVRNFYGALTIEHKSPTDPGSEAYSLENGEVIHGFEFSAASRRFIPTAYYAADSGIGLVFAHLSRSEPSGSIRQGIRIGVVGLGAGTIAAYGHAGDYIRFYEINPEVSQLATDTQYFHYVKECPANVQIVLGDARLSLEQELTNGARHDFDVLAIDAFSGDAIPVHLLTEEAFRLYFERLKNPRGVLAVHVTNTVLDLRQVAVAAANRLGLASVWVHGDGDGQISYSNEWVVVSRDPSTIESISAMARHAVKLQASQGRLWTDDYSNLLFVLAR